MNNLTKVKRVNNLIEKKMVTVPNLLLSHTYFLNDQHTCYVNIGYDINTFKTTIILFKNTVFHILSSDAWTTAVFNNLQTIKSHFSCENNISFAELPKTTGNCDVKLTCRNNERRIMFTSGGKKIVLNSKEWEHCASLSSFLQSIIIWSEAVWTDVANYYSLYLVKCFDRKTHALQIQDFFIPPVTGYNYFNYSRLFNEIPVLCRHKLINDFYVCTQEKLNE